MNREELRDSINTALDAPMAVLAFVALVLIIVDLTTEVSTAWRLRLDMVFWFVWSAFILEYVAKLLLSDNKRAYVKEHWVELAIIVVPFLRILRLFQVLRLTRSVALLRFFLFSRFGLSELGLVLSHRLSYLIVVTTVIILLGAVAAFILEAHIPGTRIPTFRDALWWSAALVTTVNSELYPITTEGRILGFALMVYSMVVFSYVAASIAAFFIGQERKGKSKSDDDQTTGAG